MKDGIILMDADAGSMLPEIHQTIKFIQFIKLEKNPVNNDKRI